MFVPQIEGILLEAPLTVKMSTRHWVQVVHGVVDDASGLAMTKLIKSNL